MKCRGFGAIICGDSAVNQEFESFVIAVRNLTEYGYGTQETVGYPAPFPSGFRHRLRGMVM